MQEQCLRFLFFTGEKNNYYENLEVLKWRVRDFDS